MDKVNDILVGILKVTPDEALKDLGMADVATWDSLSHMTLIVAIEDKFSIQLSGDDIADMISFDAIRKTVLKYTQ